MTALLVNEKYEAIQHIGSGAFADVFKARNMVTKEFVAVKRMKKDRMGKKDIQMILQEIEIMKSLKHKNIVQFIEEYKNPQKKEWLIILQYCGKGDLDAYKKKVGKIPESHCRMFIKGILEALVLLHRKGIAHRDLKLPNILIGDDYRMKLADFGLSKNAHNDMMKSYCGSPITMAPQVLDSKNYTSKCDVWSLGVLAYLMLYNKYPYLPSKSDGSGHMGILNAITNRPLMFFESVLVSESGKKFMIACMQKKEIDRPTSEELLEHEWFLELQNNHVTKMTAHIIKESEGNSSKEAINLCEIMIFGVFQHHLKKVTETLHLTEQNLKKNKAIFEKYYEDRKQIYEYYLLIVLKKMRNLGKREMIYNFGSVYKICMENIHKFKQHEKQLMTVVEASLTTLNDQKTNLEVDILTFCLDEGKKLIDSQSMSNKEIQDKLLLLKNLCKVVCTDLQPTQIVIKWGQRSDFVKYQGDIIGFLRNLTAEQILKVINKEVDSDDDLEVTWLIQDVIKEKMDQKNSNLSDIGNMALYVLNIPSNFSNYKQTNDEGGFK